MFKHILKPFDFVKKVGIKLPWLFLSILLSFIAATCDGISVALLFPLLKGVIHQDFGFLEKSIFQDILSILNLESNANILFFLLVIIIFCFSVCNQLFRYASQVMTMFLVRRATNNLRKSIFNRIIQFGKQYFDNNNIENINSLIIYHVHTVANLFRQFQQTVLYLLVMCIYFVIMFFIYWHVTLLLLLVFPFLYLGLKGLVKQIKSASLEHIFVHKKLEKHLFNTFHCMTLIKSRCQEKLEKGIFENLSNDIEKKELAVDVKLALVSPLQRIFMLCMVLLTVIIISILTQDNIIDISKVMLYFYLLRENATNISCINDFRTYLAGVKGNQEQIFEIFNDENKYFVKNGTQKFVGLHKNIEIKNLNFGYNSDKKILNDLSFTINKGEITAIIGATGSGKTTVVSLIMRLYECSSGCIFVDGLDIRELNRQSFLDKIAFVSQDIQLFNGTIKQNLTYGIRNFTDEQICNSLKKAQLADFVNLPRGLDTTIGDQGVTLSGGERQRLAIARAILKNPEILILDEATSSLDVDSESLVHQALEELTKNRTVIIIAHRLQTIKNANQIILMEEGKNIENGSMAELLAKKESFYNYWQKK